MVVHWLVLLPYSKTVKRHAICGKCELTALEMSLLKSNFSQEVLMKMQKSSV